MKKARALLNKAKELEEQAKKIELEFHQKIGKLVFSLYEKKELKDENLINKIAKIIGDNEEQINQNFYNQEI